MRVKNPKPLGRRGYGSIGHLPNSRLGEGDYHVHAGQETIATEKTRDRFDIVIVQEKLDGSNCSVAMIDGMLVPITRAGYAANTSPFEQHHLFDWWVGRNRKRFQKVLLEGEQLVGEWVACAHGTLYDLLDRDPFGVFDIISNGKRLPYCEFLSRVNGVFDTPELLHIGQPISVDKALAIHAVKNWKSDGIEGVIYRVERKGEVDFLAKFVRHDKVDGKYLKDDVWNWKPEEYINQLGEKKDE